MVLLLVTTLQQKQNPYCILLYSHLFLFGVHICMNLPLDILSKLNTTQGKIAIMSILGSFCPITRAHISLFAHTRDYLLQHSSFCDALGFVLLNSAAHVHRKIQKKGQIPLSYDERKHLIQLATKDIDWLNHSEENEFLLTHKLHKLWPKIDFFHYTLNGADDVIKYKKWRFASSEHRLIILLRPGFGERLITMMREDGAKESENCIIMPEISSASSSRVREALLRGDQKQAQALLHPDVLAWCLQNSPYQPR